MQWKFFWGDVYIDKGKKMICCNLCLCHVRVFKMSDDTNCCNFLPEASVGLTVWCHLFQVKDGCQGMKNSENIVTDTEYCPVMKDMDFQKNKSCVIWSSRSVA